MKKILVPTDFSKNAAMATDVAFDIAKKSGASIILLHVIEEVTGGSFNVEGQISGSNMGDKLFTFKMIEKARNQMVKVVKDPKYAAVKVDGELRVGNPYHGMRTIIAEHKVDLVFMGTEGRTHNQDMVIGSNTEKVIRNSHCPVLTVMKKPATIDFKNIVYAKLNQTDTVYFIHYLDSLPFRKGTIVQII